MDLKAFLGALEPWDPIRPQLSAVLELHTILLVLVVSNFLAGAVMSHADKISTPVTEINLKHTSNPTITRIRIGI